MPFSYTDLTKDSAIMYGININDGMIGKGQELIPQTVTNVGRKVINIGRKGCWKLEDDDYNTVFE